MPPLRRAAPIALILIAAAGLLYVGWAMLDRPVESACSVCGRTVHLASRVDGAADGKQFTFCCATCAVRSEQQRGRALQVTRVFDYESGEALDPAEAIAVVGGSVNLCMREHVLLGAHKEMSALHFDRCSPSVLLFKNRAAAERFRAEHGGSVEAFVDLLQSSRG